MTTNAGDRLVRALSPDGTVRLLAAEVGAVADEVARRHALAPEAARLAAELVIANLLMGAYVKGDERVMLQLQTERPEARFLGEIDADGAVRARLTPAVIRGIDRLHGALYAIKSDARRELYRGVTPLDGTTVQGALQHHLTTSDQVVAVVRVDVRHTAEGLVARGVLVERLPVDRDRPSLDDAAFEARFGAPVRDGVQVTVDGDRARLGEEPLDVLEVRPLAFRCRCSQARVETMLYGLGVDELRSILEEDGHADVSCHFCNEVRHVEGDALRALIQMHEAEAHA